MLFLSQGLYFYVADSLKSTTGGSKCPWAQNEHRAKIRWFGAYHPHKSTWGACLALGGPVYLPWVYRMVPELAIPPPVPCCFIKKTSQVSPKLCLGPNEHRAEIRCFGAYQAHKNTWRWALGFNWSRLHWYGPSCGVLRACLATGTSLFHRKRARWVRNCAWAQIKIL